MLESDSLDQISINSYDILTYEKNLLQNGGNNTIKIEKNIKRLFKCYTLSLNQNGGKDNKLSSLIKKRLYNKTAELIVQTHSNTSHKKYSKDLQGGSVINNILVNEINLYLKQLIIDMPEIINKKDIETKISKAISSTSWLSRKTDDSVINDINDILLQEINLYLRQLDIPKILNNKKIASQIIATRLTSWLSIKPPEPAPQRTRVGLVDGINSGFYPKESGSTFWTRPPGLPISMEKIETR